MEPKAKILMLKGEKGDPGGAEWGNISGSLSNQTDLKTELDNKANSADIGPAALTNDYNDLNNKPNLATVATSGSYTDLTNKPNLSTVATSGLATDLTGVLPITNGGTGASDGAIPRRFTLFSSVEGVEPTTITLSDSARNYQKIGVAVSNPELYGEVEYDYSEFVILPGVGDFKYSVRLFRIGEWIPVSLVVYVMEMVFSGTTVTLETYKKFNLDPNGITSDDLKLKIHYIYGYKY